MTRAMKKPPAARSRRKACKARAKHKGDPPQNAEQKARCALRTFFRQGGSETAAHAMIKQEKAHVARGSSSTHTGLMRILYRDKAAAEQQKKPRQHRPAVLARLQLLVDAANSAVRAGKTPSSMEQNWKQKGRLILRRAKRAEAKHKQCSTSKVHT